MSVWLWLWPACSLSVAHLLTLERVCVSGLFGFIISTVVIVIVGEIIPQAVCSRFALSASCHGPSVSPCP